MKKHTKRFSRRAAALCLAVLACSGMTVSAQGTGETFRQVTADTEADESGEITLTLEEIIEANTGIEKILGDSEMIGITEVQYSLTGVQTNSAQYAITRDGDSYAIAYIGSDYIMTLKNGSAWIQYADGTKEARAVDPAQYAAQMEQVINMAPISYSATEEFTAQVEKDGKIYIQSEDAADDDSVDGNMACFYYVLDADTLQAEQIIKSIRDENGNETKVLQTTIEYAN
ncbi:MAG: hypothetical protein Q4F41_09305 [Eubacteriales bacterium]|nr:hypothetical protein [Eubacteriales bacterium]